MVDHNLLKRKVEDDSLEDPNKKQTVNSGDVRDLFKSESHPTTEEGFVPTLNKWFAESGFLGLEHLEFKLSTRCNNSLGCFAKKSFELNDVLFSIPQKHTVNIYDILSTPLSTFIIEQSRLYKLLDICTIEFLFWLHMIAERATNKDNIYIQSLSSNSPFLNQWDTNLLSLIEHTNLFKSIQHMDIRIQQYLTFFQHLYQEIPEQAIVMLPPDCFNHPHAFYWAIGHYLSRRYPSQYAIDTNKSTTGIDLSVLKQEDNLGQVGALVPLLDILNHQNDHEYLRYEYNNHNGYLQVICNHPIAQGDELYSNYGILSNEQLLFAYGYALLDNLYDTLPMRLRSLPQLGPGNSTNNVYYLKSGGWDGIPKNLLQSLRRLREQTIIMNGEKTLDTHGNGIAAVAVEEEEVQGEGEGEGEGMEENIDIEDCEIVMNYVMDSLLTMQQCYLQQRAILLSYGIELLMTFPIETTEGDVLIDYESFQPSTTITFLPPPSVAVVEDVIAIQQERREQASFLAYYLMGQYRIIVAIAQDLQHILMTADGDAEGEEGGEGDELEEVEGDSDDSDSDSYDSLED